MLRGYASEEVHAVIERAADMLGLGTSVVRKIPVDAKGHMNAAALMARALQDITEGFKHDAPHPTDRASPRPFRLA